MILSKIFHGLNGEKVFQKALYSALSVISRCNLQVFLFANGTKPLQRIEVLAATWHVPFVPLLTKLATKMYV